MAIEVNGAVYRGAANNVQKPDMKTYDMDAVQTGINNSVTELPAGIKATGGNQANNEQFKGQKDPYASEKHIKSAISQANSRIKSKMTKLEFSYHEETNRVSIKVLDKDTEEVLREIPPEDTLEMLEKMWELAGLLIDEKR